MRAATLSLLLLTSAITAPPLTAEVVRIAVASNFKTTAELINAQFVEAQPGHSVILSSASTGTIFSQIQHGAPFDVFFAADEASPLKLLQTPFAEQSESFCYALGSLLLMGSDNPSRDLANAELSLAIANPATAPYGKAALEVLKRPEFTDASTRKLVRANNVAQAYQHWHGSTVDLALVPNALGKNASSGQGTLIPSSWYTPLEQHVIMLSRAENNPAATAYMRWLRSDKVQALINKAGYGNCL